MASSSSSFNRQSVVYFATLAMQAERYDEVTEAMKKVAEMTGELSGDERNLVSVGYKKKLRCRRGSWGVLSRLMEIDYSGRHNRNRIKEYIHKVETEINCICDEVLTLTHQNLLPSATTPDASVFYLKMKGDFFRYQAEIRTGVFRTFAVKRSSQAYQDATAIAGAHLPPTHPLRLALALNYAVLQYETCQSIEWACNITKKAIIDAAPGLQEACSDSIEIMQFLWDNTLLWESGFDDYWSEGEDI